MDSFSGKMPWFSKIFENDIEPKKFLFFNLWVDLLFPAFFFGNFLAAQLRTAARREPRLHTRQTNSLSRQFYSLEAKMGGTCTGRVTMGQIWSFVEWSWNFIGPRKLFRWFLLKDMNGVSVFQVFHVIYQSCRFGPWLEYIWFPSVSCEIDHRFLQRRQYLSRSGVAWRRARHIQWQWPNLSTSQGRCSDKTWKFQTVKQSEVSIQLVDRWFEKITHMLFSDLFGDDQFDRSFWPGLRTPTSYTVAVAAIAMSSASYQILEDSMGESSLSASGITSFVEWYRLVFFLETCIA